MSIHGEQHYGPVVRNSPIRIELTRTEAARERLILERLYSPDMSPETARALAEALREEGPVWQAILIAFGYSRRPTDGELIVENVVHWIGSNRYMLHDAWSALDGPPVDFPTFCAGFVKASGERFTDDDVRRVRKYVNDADKNSRRRQLPKDVTAALSRL